MSVPDIDACSATPRALAFFNPIIAAVLWWSGVWAEIMRMGSAGTKEISADLSGMTIPKSLGR
jgi:hypothetical protein